MIRLTTWTCFKYSNKFLQSFSHRAGPSPFLLSFLLLLSIIHQTSNAQGGIPSMHFVISVPEPASQSYSIDLHSGGWNQDTLQLKMPNWMPGYYQMMDYAASVQTISARDANGENIVLEQKNDNTWLIGGIKNRTFTVSYSIQTNRQFVATSYVDKDHAYLVPGNSFLYVDGFLDLPAVVRIIQPPEWNDIATGLERVAGKSNEYAATDFDILYDCPILMGDLDELPSFSIRGIEHQFIGYSVGDFDKALFMDKLEKTVRAAADIIGEIPYKNYTFIGIGPGLGGIEHLNNTTVSFDGNRLNSPDGMDRMMSFLCHEYFHHYNVKRIRPFELGPFDYDRGSRTNLLWLSEGFTVFYESRILKRAGLIDAEALLTDLTEQVNTLENDSGRFHQTLSQASYSTWEEGPFGSRGKGPDRSISVYNKGAVFAMLLDLEIRNATNNNSSLDDVMRTLYWKYYKEEARGFTDAEFQQICELVAGVSLTDLFEYVYTTKEFDYTKYLAYAGLEIERQISSATDESGKQNLLIHQVANPNPLQFAILNSLLGK